MDEYGLLLYGFGPEEARTICSSFGEIVPGPIAALSASGGESRLVSEILDSPSDFFEQGDVRILMFLGFGDDEIRRSLSRYPKEIKRPIFCTLTENNSGWTFGYLVEHLREEHLRARSGG